MIRWILTGLLLISGFTSAQAARTRLEPIQFTREFSAVDGTDLSLTWRETWRIEHFLRHVFPSREMCRFERAYARQEVESDEPIDRGVEYALIEQEGYRFILVHFHVGRAGEAETNVLAVYRLESSGPNQVWRSRAWQSTYPEFHFQTARIGWRNIVLFKEGRESAHFGLAGIFSFHNAPRGLYIRALTPELPCLRAITRFPLRPLLARDISLEIVGGTHAVMLSASDEAFVGPSRAAGVEEWIFNDRRGAFEFWGGSNEAAR